MKGSAVRIRASALHREILDNGICVGGQYIVSALLPEAISRGDGMKLRDILMSPNERRTPALDGATTWLNSDPPGLIALRTYVQARIVSGRTSSSSPLNPLGSRCTRA